MIRFALSVLSSVPELLSVVPSLLINSVPPISCAPAELVTEPKLMMLAPLIMPLLNSEPPLNIVPPELVMVVVERTSSPAGAPISKTLRFVKLVSPCTVPVGIEISVEPSGLVPVLQSVPVLQFPLPPFHVFCDRGRPREPQKCQSGIASRLRPTCAAEGQPHGPGRIARQKRGLDSATNVPPLVVTSANDWEQGIHGWPPKTFDYGTSQRDTSGNVRSSVNVGGCQTCEL